MKLSQTIFFGVLIGAALAENLGRNRRGLPSGSFFVKDPSPTTFTGYQQQYYYNRPTWGGYGGGYGGSYGYSSYGPGTYGNFGGNKYYGGNYGGVGYNGGSSSSGFGGAYG